MSARRIIGFACNQAFVFFLFYLAVPREVDLGAGILVRPDYIAMLLFMVVGFALVRLIASPIGPDKLQGALSRPLLYLYSVLAAVGSLFPLLFPVAGIAAVIGEGVLVGFPCSLLLTAWGRAFGCEGTRVSVPEVFLGSLVAALVCLVFSLVAESPFITGGVCFLPLASVVNIEVPDKAEQPVREDASVRLISFKMLAGTFLFGLAAGVMTAHRAQAGNMGLPSYQLSMVLFGAFLIGSLTLLLSDGFGRGAALNKSYRLAVYLMVVGILIAPWPLLTGTPLSAGSVPLAGYLGLEAVFISLFIVMAEITGEDCAVSFSSGFFALFSGQLAGGVLPLGPVPEYVAAGVIALASYVFLFTERDFDALSQIVSDADSFEDVCAAIAERYRLSQRESEILAYALRGRTSERIAQELVISKSTVDTHLRRIYSKCGVHSRQELLDLANL